MGVLILVDLSLLLTIGKALLTKGVGVEYVAVLENNG